MEITGENMKTRIRGFIRRCEGGFDVTFTAMSYIMILFLLLVMVFEFGRLAYVSSVSYNAARAAAQEAVKEIDIEKFVDSQEFFLTDESLVTAAETYRLMTDGVIPPIGTGRPIVTRHSLRNGQNFIRVEVSTLVSMPMLESLSLAAIPPVMLTVEAIAEPAYGIDEETQ
jgi:hypothetical protein